MGSLSIWHWLVVAIVIMLLFGKGRISDMMGDLATGIKSFKKGLADDDETAPESEKPMIAQQTQVGGDTATAPVEPTQAAPASADSKPS